ncbi:MAG: hypothetical protein ACI9HU_000865 [Colwellia sp.]|jgi:hypothetical protein
MVIELTISIKHNNFILTVIKNYHKMCLRTYFVMAYNVFLQAITRVIDANLGEVQLSSL